MKCITRLVAIASMVALSACESTGDPTKGGLFGWSEDKARERQQQRHSRVESAATELAQEETRGEVLQNRDAYAGGQLDAARTQRVQTEELLRTLEQRLVAKTLKLENDSPTDAMASRARSYRLQVHSIAGRTSFPPRERIRQLRTLEGAIDTAQASLR
jgi:hypothetical protein